MLNKKTVGILGSTGSIGKNACQLLKQRNSTTVEFLVCNNNFDEISYQIKTLAPKAVYVGEKIRNQIKDAFSTIQIYDDIPTLLENHPTDITLHAISGIDGITCVTNAVKNTQTLALANKESIVSAWEFIAQAAIESGTQVIPVDSEHNSLYRILELIPSDAVSKIGITASGGPFFGKKFSELQGVLPNEALLHPTWQMGIKNTIDSATMANKVLEIIEATQLFSCPEESIDVVIHRQSIVHASVWLKTGGIISFSSKPDMRLHIAHAMFGEYEEEAQDIFKNVNLEFYEIKEDEFPIYFLGRKVAKTMDSSIFTIFNVANEVATTKFTNGEIKYTDILTTIDKSLNNITLNKVKSIEELTMQIKQIKEKALTLV